MNNKDNLRVIKIIRYMYKFWLVLPDYYAQIVAIFSQMHVSIDSNTKLKRPKEEKFRHYNYLK